MKKVVMIPALAFVAALLAACNTVEGVGRDVQAAGEAVEGGARSTAEDMSN